VALVTGMISHRFAPWTFAALGAGAFLLLQLHFAVTWTSYYAHFPIMGFQRAMESGLIPPFLTTSTRSLLVGRVVLLLLPLGTLWFRNGRRRDALLALWSGVMLVLVLVWIGTKRLREDSNLWPFDLVFLLFVTGVPLLLGAFFQAGLQVALAFLRKRSRHQGKVPPGEGAA